MTDVPTSTFPPSHGRTARAFGLLRGPLDRRRFLRGAGAAAVALPFLDAMTPLGVLGRAVASSPDGAPPQRFVACCATLGFHTPFLFPQQAGRDFSLTPYLEKLQAHRNNLTIFSGLSHPEQQGNNGHASELTWLTAAQRPGLAGFRNSISLDQVIADHVGPATRYPSLVLSTSGRSMSWTSSGVEIPGETSPMKLYRALFVEGDTKAVATEMKRLLRGQSILDTVLDDARRLQRDLGGRDRAKLDEYFTAVRDLEVRLRQSQDWVTRPKPKPALSEPKDIADRKDDIARQRLMYDMLVMALQTDSTRVATFQLSGMNDVPIVPGVTQDWHNLSHHGKDPDKIEELRLIEEAEFTVLGEFLTKLANINEGHGTLLDHTTVLYGSNLGNASSHDWHNVPVLVAGGRFRHGQHIARDQKNNTPLSNLFVTLAQNHGLEIDRFGSSTTAGIDGFEPV